MTGIQFLEQFFLGYNIQSISMANSTTCLTGDRGTKVWSWPPTSI